MQNGSDKMEEKTAVEFRLINTEEMPPIVITHNERDEPKVVLNTYHRTWISLHRKTIAGIVVNLQEKMDTILDGLLREQRSFEKMDDD